MKRIVCLSKKLKEFFNEKADEISFLICNIVLKVMIRGLPKTGLLYGYARSLIWMMAINLLAKFSNL